MRLLAAPKICTRRFREEVAVDRGREPRDARSFAAASRICAAGIARSAASVSAPTTGGELRAPASSPCASGTGGQRRQRSTRRSRRSRRRSGPFDSGDAICALTAIEPADSPAIVTFRGSPPNAAMFFVHPLQRGVLIEQRVVARRVVRRFLRQLGMREEAEDAEPVIHREARRCPSAAMLSPS